MRHPISVVSERLGPQATLGLLVGGVLLVGVATPEAESGVAFVGAAVAAVVLASSAPESLLDPAHPDGELGEHKRAYVEGEITLSEFEDRVEVVVDSRAAQIREASEEVHGIGPATSATLALRYESVEDLRRATEEGEVEGVNGVGPQRAEALRERLGGGST